MTDYGMRRDADYRKFRDFSLYVSMPLIRNLDIPRRINSGGI